MDDLLGKVEVKLKEMYRESVDMKEKQINLHC